MTNIVNKLKEIANNLPHKKVYIGIGVFVFLLLITFVIKGTHAFYNSTPDTIPLVNAKVGDFKPKLTKVSINNETNQPKYTNNKKVNVYLTWSNEDITQYCLSETNSCTNYTALSGTYTQNKKATIIYNFSGEGTKTIYARIKDKYNRESDISFSTSIIVDTTAPTVSKVETSNITETSVTIKITASDTKAGVDKVSEIKQYCLTPTTQGVQCNKTGTFTISNLQAGTPYNWNYYVEDNANNQTTNQTVSFTTIKPISDLVNVCTSYSNIGECVQNGHLDEIPNLESTSNMNERNDTLRRFQSTDKDAITNNYICFGATNCGDKDDHMYRIIGVVAQDDSVTGEKAGMLKIIKQTPLNGTYKWHSAYGNTSYRWNDVMLYKQLNGINTYDSKYPSDIFLTNPIYIPNENVGSKKWKDIIADIKWRYGDINNPSDYASGTAVLAKEKSWTTTVPAKIGLMYLSDYYLAYDTTTNWYKQTGTGNWLHTANNSDTGKAEWTVLRYSSANAWYVRADGNVAKEYKLDYMVWVRPVFYLSEKIKIKAGTTGAIDNPYIIESVSE